MISPFDHVAMAHLKNASNPLLHGYEPSKESVLRSIVGPFTSAVEAELAYNLLLVVRQQRAHRNQP